MKFGQTFGYAAFALALTVAGGSTVFVTPAVAATIVTEDFIGVGNDCSGEWGRPFDACKTPDREGYASSPIVAKWDVDTGDWEFAASAGALLAEYFTITMSDDDDGGTGSWTYDPTGCDSCKMITSFVVKSATNFRWYYTNPKTAIFSGTWETVKKNGKPQGLSHISFYDTGDTPPPPPPPVPVPAAGFLLIGGLGALAALRRRKAKAV